MTPRWVPLAAVIAIHDRQIARHGGAPGLRDRGLLEAAHERPVNRHAYGEADHHILAAAYAFGIAKAHAFIDGNKRTAFVTAVTFLGLNDWQFRAPALEVVSNMEKLAADELEEAECAQWFRRRSVAN